MMAELLNGKEMTVHVHMIDKPSNRRQMPSLKCRLGHCIIELFSNPGPNMV